MKKIIFIVGMLALVISCKMPNDYSDTDISNQTQIENPSSEITDDEENSSSEIEDENNEENKPSNPIEDEEENLSSEITDDEENKPSNSIEDDFKLENDSCEIDENITPNDLIKFNYFICFNKEEKLINKIYESTDSHSNFDHLEIHTSINEYVFDLWITKSENKLKVLKHNGGNPTLKNVYLENGDEIHIVF
jgi:hypothetical protein